MVKKYNEELKKQVVHDYLKGTSYPQLSKEYGIAKRVWNRQIYHCRLGKKIQ